MTHENNNSNWKAININAGNLIGIATLFAAAIVIGIGVPTWLDGRIDDRIHNRLGLIEHKVDRVERHIKEIRDEMRR